MNTSLVSKSATMYYISYLSGTLLTEVWCNLTAFLTVQKAAKAMGAKVITRHVFTNPRCEFKPDNDGIAKVATCFVRPS